MRRIPAHLPASGSGRCRAPGVLPLRCSAGYPAKPVRLVVQVTAGSSPDIIARLMGQWLSERLGQPFVIDNRPGASGNIATEAAIRAPADGYSLLFCMSANAINASLYDDLRFNFMRDTAPVASIGRIPLVMEVNPQVPAKTVPSSSPMPRRTQAGSTWPRAAIRPRCTWPASCSR